MQATQWRHRLYARIARTPLAIPVFGALLLAALWLALVGRLDAERDAAIAAAMRHTEASATAFAEHTRRELRDIDRTASLVKAQFEPDGIVNLSYLIRNRLVPLDGPVRISLADRAGNIIATTGEQDATVNVADRDYFRRHRERDTGSLDVSQPTPDPYSGQPSIAMTRRLNRGDGSFAGIVIVSIASGYFVDYYRESELGQKGLLAVVGTDGAYRARRAGDNVVAPLDASATPLFAAASAKDEGSYIGASVIDNTRRILAYRKLPDYPLIIAVAKAEGEVLADFAQRRRVYLAAGAAASFAIVVFLATNTLLVHRARRSAREVRNQRKFLQALIDNIPMGLVVRSMTGADRGRVAVWNPAAEDIFGVPAAAALGRPMAEVVSQEFAAGMEDRDRALLASPMVQSVPQVAADVPDRGRRVFSMVRAPIFGETGEVEHVVSIIHDATDEQARMDELRLNAKVFETTADAIVLCDAQDRVISVNAAFSKLTGFAPGDMLGTALVETPFASSDPPEERAARQAQFANDGCVMAEVLRHRIDGSELPCWLTKTCVRDESGRVVNYVRVHTDISRLKAAQRELERLASVDALTGLLNRRMFHDRLERALKRAQRTGKSVGLLFIDLDAFKQVNDTHGHAAGDAVLKQVARRLQRCVRASDSLCRLGGDEFTIVMEDSRLPRDAEAVAQRIAQELEAPFTVAGQPVSCHASIGIALYPDDGVNAEMLQYVADSAMYRAKRAGRHGRAPPAMSSGDAKTALAVAAR